MTVSVNEAAVKRVLMTLMPTWHARDVQRIEYLPGGYTNRNYRVDVREGSYVLRVAGRRPFPHERHYLTLDIAPDVVAHDPRQGHLLTRWIDGRILADAPPTPEEAGVYLRDLHARIPAAVNRYDYTGEVASMLSRAGHVDSDVRDCFHRIGWRPHTWVGCHNDLNPWNIIRTSTRGETARFRTLDWESAGDNDPLFDLVGLCVGLGWGVPEAEVCRGAYGGIDREIRATRTRLEDTFRAFLIREYAWAAAQVATGNDRPEIRAQIATSRDSLMAWG